MFIELVGYLSRVDYYHIERDWAGYVVPAQQDREITCLVPWLLVVISDFM